MRHFDDISANPGVAIEPDAIRCSIDYQPQPRQKLLHTCPANEILFGSLVDGGIVKVELVNNSLSFDFQVNVEAVSH